MPWDLTGARRIEGRGAYNMQISFTNGTPHIGPHAGLMAQSRLGVGALDQQDQQIAGIAATAVTTTATILVALGTIGGPVGAAIAGIAAIGIAIANAFSGCGQTCVAASNIANQVEAILAQNLQHYLTSPVHYRSLQLAALNNFDIAWAALLKACSNQQLLQAGVNCIADRQQGACKWQTSPAGWQQQSGQWVYVGAGQAGSGSSCWNWFVGYRDAIANDPTVVPDPAPAQTDIFGNPMPASTGTYGSGGSFGVAHASTLPLLLIGGGTIAALMLMGDN